MAGFRPGEIYGVALDKKRPVVVVSRAELNRGDYLVIVPFTSKRLEERRSLPNCVFFHAGQYGLTKDCVAQAEHIATIRVDDLARPLVPIGMLDAIALNALIAAVGHVLDSDCQPKAPVGQPHV